MQLASSAALYLVERWSEPNMTTISWQALISLRSFDGDVSCWCRDGNRYKDKCADCCSSTTHSKVELMNVMQRYLPANAMNEVCFNGVQHLRSSPGKISIFRSLQRRSERSWFQSNCPFADDEKLKLALSHIKLWSMEMCRSLSKDDIIELWQKALHPYTTSICGHNSLGLCV